MSTRQSMSLVLAAATMLMNAPMAGAQGTQGVQLSANGYMQNVYVTVLGGWAPSGSQLYFFPDAFDPVTGAFAPNKKVAIGPQLQRAGNSAFVAAANSTDLGTFNPGSQLVFGVLLPDNTWRYTGIGGTQGAVALRNNVNNRYTQNQVGVAGATSQIYGWDLNSYQTHDYNDLMFDVSVVSQAVVTPEPASMSLIALGLVGVGGIVRRRRKRAEQ